MLALEAGVDALCVGHDLGEDAVDRIRAALVADVSTRAGSREAAGRVAAARSLGAAALPGRRIGRRGCGRAARAARRGRSRRSAGRRCVVELRPRRTSPRARPSTGLADAHSSCARASRSRRPTCSSSATRTGMPGCGEAADRPTAVIVVETGLPVWRPSRARGLRRDATAAAARLAATAARARCWDCDEPSRARAARAAGGARAADRRSSARYAERIAALFRRADVQYVLIASRGSSSNAARYAQYLLGRAHRVPVAFATPSLFTLYEQPPRLDGALVVGISQSGESPDVVEVLRRRSARDARRSRSRTRPPRRSALVADAVVKLEAGKEEAVAATKTYVNSLGAIALIFATATGDAARARASSRPFPARSRRSSSARGRRLGPRPARRRRRRDRRRARHQLLHVATRSR